MDHGPPIFTRVHDNGIAFVSLEQALKASPRFAAQVRPEAVKDELDRFRIWAGNIAAHRKGRRSLEYRLRDAAHLKTETHNLLTALQDSLENAHAIVTEQKTPWDELSDSDSDSESSSQNAGDGGDQKDTELKQLLASVKNSITCLFRISMSVRDPAPNNQSQSTITVDKSYFVEHDILHTREKFPGCKEYLIERLGRALSGRRQYLSYREAHHQKLAKNVEIIGFEQPRTEHTSNSTEATPVPIARTNSLNVLDGDDALSQTSYATSVNAAIRVPPLPKQAREEEHFECPLCFMIVSIHTKAGWKQHVYRDLHPYCCTFDQCTTADRLYDSRQAWFTHELEAHRSSWQCVEGCDKTFSTEGSFENHVQKSHPDLTAPKMLAALKRTAARTANLTEQADCPLCDKRMTLRGLQKHLGRHHEELALFALPPNLEATEEEPQDDEEGSLDVERWQDEDLSDVSDTANAGDQDEEPKYCICNEVSYGEMIACDNNGCEKEWFHLSCVGMTSQDIPADHRKWYCPECRPLMEPDAYENPALPIPRPTTVIEEDESEDMRLSRLERLLDVHQQQIEISANKQKEVADEIVEEAAPKVAEAEEGGDEDALAKQEQLRQKAPAEAAVTAEEHEKALAEAAVAAVELKEAKELAEEEAAKLKPKEVYGKPIKFKDAVGRNFSIPWQTWKGMEEFIKEAFVNVDVLGAHVQEGHYDLVGPNGEIILPQTWETMVQRGIAITMRMWPIPEPPLRLSSATGEDLNQKPQEAVDGFEGENILAEAEDGEPSEGLSNENASRIIPQSAFAPSLASSAGTEDLEQEAEEVPRQAVDAYNATQPQREEEARVERARIIAENEARTDEAEREAKAARRQAVDEFNAEKSRKEREAIEARERAIAEYERKKSSDAAQAKKQREELITQLKLEEEMQEEEEKEEYERKKRSDAAEARKQRKKELFTQLKLEEEMQKEKEKEEYERFLRKQKQKAEEENAKKQAQEEQFEEKMRQRLIRFGFDENQIQAMVHGSFEDEPPNRSRPSNERGESSPSQEKRTLEIDRSRTNRNYSNLAKQSAMTSERISAPAFVRPSQSPIAPSLQTASRQGAHYAEGSHFGSGTENEHIIREREYRGELRDRSPPADNDAYKSHDSQQEGTRNEAQLNERLQRLEALVQTLGAQTGDAEQGLPSGSATAPGNPDQLMERLHRLEGVVLSLDSQVHDGGQKVSKSGPSKEGISTAPPEPVLVEKPRGDFSYIEKSLASWARNQQRQGLLLTDAILYEKARSFATTVGNHAGDPTADMTSWLEGFKQRNGLTVAGSRKISVVEESKGKSNLPIESHSDEGGRSTNVPDLARDNEEDSKEIRILNSGKEMQAEFSGEFKQNLEAEKRREETEKAAQYRREAFDVPLSDHAPASTAQTSFSDFDSQRNAFPPGFDNSLELSLLNVDKLIASSTNEEEKQELEQQKQLLRNRQAHLTRIQPGYLTKVSNAGDAELDVPIPAENDEDDSSVVYSEEQTRDAWRSLRTQRERQEEARLESLKQRADEEEAERQKLEARLQGKAPAKPLQQTQSPTYIKVHKQHLAIDTLVYYDIPYEMDRADPDYIIILREWDAKETEVLFEHTRRLRDRGYRRNALVEEHDPTGKRDYMVRKRPVRRSSLPFLTRGADEVSARPTESVFRKPEVEIKMSGGELDFSKPHSRAQPRSSAPTPYYQLGKGGSGPHIFPGERTGDSRTVPADMWICGYCDGGNLIALAEAMCPTCGAAI